MKRAYVVLALVLLIVVGFRVVTATLGRKDDATLIKDSLRQSLEASRKGEAGGVLDLLSNSITLNGETQSGVTSQVADFIRKQRPDVEVQNQQPIVTGDEARITSPITIKADLPIVGTQSIQMRDVVLTFQRETGRTLLVLPVTKWRLTGITAPPDALSGLVGMGFGG